MSIQPKFLETLPLRYKLTALISFSTILVSLLGMGVYVVSSIDDLRARLEDEGRVIAHAVAAYSAPDLAFGDLDAANDTLAALVDVPNVVNAFMFDNGARLFAQLRATDATPSFTRADATQVETRDEFLYVAEPALYKSKRHGTLLLQYTLQPLREHARAAWATFAAMAATAVVLAMLLALWLQRFVSLPIQNLARAAQHVAQETDYAYRVVPPSRDEIGALYTVFNTMLERIDAKQAELLETYTEVQRLNTGLEQRVAARTTELSAVNKELEAFSYSVSHDLRAPLRAIHGFSAALVEDCAASLTPDCRSYLQRIQAASVRMGHLIDDLLQLSRITRSTLKRSPIDLSQLATQAVDELQQREPRREVETHIATSERIDADPALMTIVLNNLLGNAWKFTRRRPHVRIEFGQIERGDETVFYVRDNGAGFDMNHADKLFGAFQRLHSNHEFEGTGIGLSIVHRIIRRHGGRIWAEAKPDEGATFYFTLGGTQ